MATSPTGEALAEVLLGTTGLAEKGWMILVAAGPVASLKKRFKM
jgi:hypothetical protein